MLFVQLAQVLLHRPSRDQTFWGIICYSSILFAFVMAAIVGKFKHAEVLYVLHDDYPGGGRAYYSTHAVPWCQILLQIRCVITCALSNEKSSDIRHQRNSYSLFRGYAYGERALSPTFCLFFWLTSYFALQFYRLMVLYTRQWIILILPAALYLARIGKKFPPKKRLWHFF